MKQEIVLLSRMVDALMIPSGAPIQLPAGTEVTITQELGGSFTVNVYGNLFRIDGKEGDALGRIKADPLADKDLDAYTLEEWVQAQLKTCYDPEIPVNIVDLGLIYECRLKALESDDYSVHIKMTLTAPGCGMGPVLQADLERKLMAHKHIKRVEVEWVFDPPWDRSMMSAAAQLELGVF